MTRSATTLNTGSGGDQIANEVFGSQRIQLFKMLLGAEGVDGGNVGPWNRVPTEITFNAAHLGAFGDLIAQPLTPAVQLDWTLGTLLTQLMTSSATGTGAAVDVSSGRLRVQSGTGAAGNAWGQSVRVARYRAGQGMEARFTAAFATSAANSTQIVGVASDSTPTNAYGVGYNGTTFGFWYYNNGTPTHIPQASWTVDKCNGSGASGFTITPANLNVFFVRYPFLGAGDVHFYVQDSTTGRMIHAHTIQYANTSQSLEITVPSMRFFAQAKNSGNTTNLTIFVGSAGIFVCGTRAFLGPRYALDNSKAAVTAETSILSIRNATTFNGVANTALARIVGLYHGHDGGNGVGTFRLRRGATVGGVPAFTPINGSTADNGVTITSGQSPISFDVAGTTSTGAASTSVLTGATSRNEGTGIVPVDDADLWILPGETWTLAMTCGASATAYAGLAWMDDL